MEEDTHSLHNANPFLLKEDIFSAYLNMNNPNSLAEPSKFASEDFFFRPDTNYFDKYFDNDKLSNISKEEHIQIKFEPNDQEKDIPEFPSKPMNDSTEATYQAAHNTKTLKTDLIIKSKIALKEDLNNMPDSDRNMKLLKNRLSARKCRQKKKTYIKDLEEEVQECKAEIEKYKQASKKEQNLENIFHRLKEKENEMDFSHMKKTDQSQIDYIKNQRKLLTTLFNRHVRSMMPIECKLFQKKFLNHVQIEEEDKQDTILSKINHNLEKLNELYGFKKIKALPNKGNEKVAYKLYMFYDNLRKYTEIFVANLKMI